MNIYAAIPNACTLTKRILWYYDYEWKILHRTQWIQLILVTAWHTHTHKHLPFIHLPPSCSWNGVGMCLLCYIAVKLNMSVKRCIFDIFLWRVTHRMKLRTNRAPLANSLSLANGCWKIRYLRCHRYTQLGQQALQLSPYEYFRYDILRNSINFLSIKLTTGNCMLAESMVHHFDK